MPTRTFSFDELETADLIIDAVYEGGSKGNVGDDPIHRLVGGGNLGGFRYQGNTKCYEIDFCVLYSSLNDPDWPDTLDPESGSFTYYGDHKRPGQSSYNTPKRGNVILRDSFYHVHTGQRDVVPPFFVFTKAGTGRDIMFRGLAVPGAPHLSQTDDLVAIWKITGGERFQNFRAVFSILDVPRISRAWIDEVTSGHSGSEYAPENWISWIASGVITPLTAERSVRHRSKGEQLPKCELRCAILERIYSFYKAHPDGAYAFERCAAALVRMMDKHVARCDLTRPWRDGGRDAIGEYRIGPHTSSIEVGFALEAKCYQPSTGVGIRHTSRLLSRIRHRQFGIFVTTSYLSEQAYKEIVEDNQPIVVISGRDIVDILVESGYSDLESIDRWLNRLPDRSFT